MKDDNDKLNSEYDIDKIIEEFSSSSKEKEEIPVPENPAPKKKFVVHIDESLMDEPGSDDFSKQNTGGIYFSNYAKSRPQQKNTKLKYGSTQPVTQHSPVKKQISSKTAAVKEITKANVEKIGGKAAAGFLAFIIAATLVLSYIGITCAGDMLAVNRSDENVPVSIPEGAKYTEIIDILQDAGLVKRKMFCKLFIKFRDFDDEKYLSGDYYLNSKMGIEGMMKDIMAAPVTADTITLSFPEGWTMLQIFEKLQKYDVCDSSKLYTAAKSANFSYDFIGDIADNAKRYQKLEGYLFPDTYDFYVGADTNYVIRKFLDNFDSKWEDGYDQRAESLGFTRDEVIIIASIVQKEAANADQMKTIASVILNRLKDQANFPTLGCDSTAVYVSNYVTPIVGEAQGAVFTQSYDTSAVKGLPPGPICNPGIDAIRSVLYPEDTGYYYFAHDNNGRIYLAKTYQEHKNNLILIIKANNGN